MIRRTFTWFGLNGQDLKMSPISRFIFLTTRGETRSLFTSHSIGFQYIVRLFPAGINRIRDFFCQQEFLVDKFAYFAPAGQAKHVSAQKKGVGGGEPDTKLGQK
jgi:hypothetical protein